MDAFASSEIDSAARPLLRLALLVSGQKTAFVCSSHGLSAGQRVIFSVSQGELEVVEGTVAAWDDAGYRASLGIHCWHCEPIRVGEATLAVLCSAGKAPCELRERQREGLRFIADALEHLLVAARKRVEAESRMSLAEEAIAEAREEAIRHAADSVQMRRLAHTDVLTGLPNRRGFMTRWEEQVAHSTRRGTPLGLLLIDADDFKEVNDTLGHAMGDAVLRAISTSLLVARRPPEIVARLGGDEFALATANGDADHLMELANTIRSTFAVVAEELGVTTTLSIGIASSDSGGREHMLRDADEALYRSKAAGGNTAEAYAFARS